MDIEATSDGKIWVLTYNGALLYIEDELQKFEKDFFSGGDVGLFLQKLLSLENRVKMYQPLTTNSCLSCIRWKYLLALSHKLTGQNLLAKQGYYEIWRDYPDSPYSIMAKAKLSVGR